MTDAARILRYLKAGHDVCALEWDGSRPVADSGKPVKRVAARIQDLRDQGWTIDTVGKRNRMAVYRLRPLAPTPAEPAARAALPRGWRDATPEGTASMIFAFAPIPRVVLWGGRPGIDVQFGEPLDLAVAQHRQAMAGAPPRDHRSHDVTRYGAIRVAAVIRALGKVGR